MSFTTKLAAGVMLAAATSTALTGCGKKSTASTAKTTPSMSASSSASKTSSMGTMSTMSATPSTDASGFVTATIGGKTKHIKAGQQCQKAHASDYTQYGFTCAADSSGTYVLTKN